MNYQIFKSNDPRKCAKIACQITMEVVPLLRWNRPWEIKTLSMLNTRYRGLNQSSQYDLSQQEVGSDVGKPISLVHSAKYYLFLALGTHWKSHCPLRPATTGHNSKWFYLRQRLFCKDDTQKCLYVATMYRLIRFFKSSLSWNGPVGCYFL